MAAAIGVATPIIMARPHTATPLRPAAVAILTAHMGAAVITIIIMATTVVAIIITIPATTAETATMAATAIMVAVMEATATMVAATEATDVMEEIRAMATEGHRLIHRQVLLPRQARHQLPTTGVFLHRRPPADIAKNKADSKKESAFSFF